MRAWKKRAILLALCLCGAGLLLSFVAMMGLGFDFHKLNNVTMTENTYPVEEAFQNISISCAEADIVLVPLGDDEESRVVVRESDKIFHTVSVENGTLTVTRKDTRAWYEHFGVYWAGMKLTVYLPKQDYAALQLSTVSGEISVAEELTFDKANLSATSGDVRFQAAAEELYLDTVSGDVILDAPSLKELDIKTVSGDIRLANISCDLVALKTTSGEIRADNVTATKEIRIEAVSGDVELGYCDGGSLQIETVSGDVDATLLTAKQISTDTVSGDVRVPAGGSGGKCRVNTVSGDICIEYAN